MSSPATPASLPGVLDVREFLAPAPREGAFDLVIEVPHGAQGAAEYAAVADRLESPLPADLDHFFHVNTDSGAAEIGAALAERLCAAGVVRRVVLLRCRVPRTFIDCNRVLDGTAEAYRAGGVTPGVPPWITAPADHAFLVEQFTAYQAVVKAVVDDVCGRGGRALLLHTYAPRTVDVQVGLDIVPALHAAYAEIGRWPLRPEVDLIFRLPDGTRSVPQAQVDALRKALAGVGLPLAEGVSYPMHPITAAYAHVMKWPGQVLCVEVRRDLITEAFVPFVEVVSDPARVARVAEGFAAFVDGGWVQAGTASG